MVDDGPTQWIEQLAQGDEEAAQRIWERYYEQLVRVARRKLRAAARRMADEEDAVLSAFDSFCRGAAEGRFPMLSDRDGLWKLLVTITSRKAVAQMRHGHRLKRGGGAVRGESAFVERSVSHRPKGLESVAAPEPTPEFAVLIAEQCEALLDELRDDSLRRVAVMKMEGYSNREIARSLECSLATVERKLARIRDKWESGLGESE